MLAENPRIRYFSDHRGYVRTRITPNKMRVNLRVGAVRVPPGYRYADRGWAAPRFPDCGFRVLLRGEL